MHEDAQQPDLVIKVQREIAQRMRELDLAIDSYAKLLVELELLELEARSYAAEADEGIPMRLEQPPE